MLRLRRGTLAVVRPQKALGHDLGKLRDEGKLYIVQMDAAEVSPGEFAHLVREVVNQHGAQTVLIDSLNGYQAAMPEENALILHVHELLQYLNRQGANTFADGCAARSCR